MRKKAHSKMKCVRKKVPTIKCYIIVNSTVEQKNVPVDCILTDKDGLKYFNDSYGMGAIHWPIIDKPGDAYERHLVENVKWAKNRLPYARKESPKEVKGLLAVIKSKGKTRSIVWGKKLKKYT